MAYFDTGFALELRRTGARNAISGLQLNAANELAEAMGDAMDLTFSTIPKRVQELQRVLSSPTLGGSIREQYWAARADSVKDAVVRSYAARKRLGPSGYRPGSTGKPDWKRFSGGELKRALKMPDNYQSSAVGISLFNATVLDEKAAQWYRLNFGTAPNSRVAEQFSVTFGSGVEVLSLFLEGQPSAAFRIPKGFWTENGEFHLNDPDGTLIPQDARRTKGIKPARFLDAGVRRLARDLGGDNGEEASFRGLYKSLWDFGVATVVPRGRLSQGQTSINITLVREPNDVV